MQAALGFGVGIVFAAVFKRANMMGSQVQPAGLRHQEWEEMSVREEPAGGRGSGLHHKPISSHPMLVPKGPSR